MIQGYKNQGVVFSMTEAPVSRLRKYAKSCRSKSPEIGVVDRILLRVRLLAVGEEERLREFEERSKLQVFWVVMSFKRDLAVTQRKREGR